jgi:hypothetical protein
MWMVSWRRAMCDVQVCVLLLRKLLHSAIHHYTTVCLPAAHWKPRVTGERQVKIQLAQQHGTLRARATSVIITHLQNCFFET